MSEKRFIELENLSFHRKVITGAIVAVLVGIIAATIAMAIVDGKAEALATNAAKRQAEIQSWGEPELLTIVSRDRTLVSDYHYTQEVSVVPTADPSAQPKSIIIDYDMAQLDNIRVWFHEGSPSWTVVTTVDSAATPYVYYPVAVLESRIGAFFGLWFKGWSAIILWLLVAAIRGALWLTWSTRNPHRSATRLAGIH